MLDRCIMDGCIVVAPLLQRVRLREVIVGFQDASRHACREEATISNTVPLAAGLSVHSSTKPVQNGLFADGSDDVSTSTGTTEDLSSLICIRR